MKKNLSVIAIILMLFIGSCIVHQDVPPPELTVIPDSIQPISPVDIAEFQIRGFSNEDLVRFQIITVPQIYSFDTSFEVFSHSFSKKISLKTPDNLTVEKDSIIEVIFTLEDTQNKTVVKRELKLVEGYPPVIKDFVRLVFKKDSNLFYSASELKSYNCNDIQDDKIDLVLTYNEDDGFGLVSADAAYGALIITQNFCNYNIDNKNHTKITKSSLDLGEISPKLLYYLETEDALIHNNPNEGTGIINLQENETAVFQISDGRKGILKILDINDSLKSVYFELFVQKYAVIKK